MIKDLTAQNVPFFGELFVSSEPSKYRCAAVRQASHDFFSHAGRQNNLLPVLLKSLLECMVVFIIDKHAVLQKSPAAGIPDTEVVNNDLVRSSLAYLGN